MCHTCLLTKELAEFRKIQLSGFKKEIYPPYEVNNCFTCEANGAFDIPQDEHIGLKYGDLTFFDHKVLADSFECAFVGNTPYKQICKIYKIKHETNGKL